MILYCERFGLNYISAETTEYRISLNDNTTYKPDFLINKKFIVEIKPKSRVLINTAKFSYLRNEYKKLGYKFKVISPKVLKYDIIFEMMYNNKVQHLNIKTSKICINFMEKYELWKIKNNLKNV